MMEDSLRAHERTHIITVRILHSNAISLHDRCRERALWRQTAHVRTSLRASHATLGRGRAPFFDFSFRRRFLRSVGDFAVCVRAVVLAMSSSAPAADAPCSHHPLDPQQTVYSDEFVRIVLVAKYPAFPAYFKVIWVAGCVCELSQLSAAGRRRLWLATLVAERALRALCVPPPTKINVCSIGNTVPHLHMHVMGRYEGDAKWPHSFWSPDVADAANPTLRGVAAPTAAQCVAYFAAPAHWRDDDDDDDEDARRNLYT